MTLSGILGPMSLKAMATIGISLGPELMQEYDGFTELKAVCCRSSGVLNKSLHMCCNHL